MNKFSEYLVDNFALLCASLGMLFIIIYNYKVRNRTSKLCLAIIGVAVILSVITFTGESLKTDQRFQNVPNIVFIDTIFMVLGYILRPFLIFLFILLAEKEISKKRLLIYLIPQFICTIIFLFPLFFGTPLAKLTVYLQQAVAEDGSLYIHWNGGELRYTAHIVAAIYLIYLFYTSFRKIQAKHYDDALILVSCTIFVVVATVIESVFDVYNLVNATAVISCIFYYLFLYNQTARRDPLTGLYNRATYYNDVERFEKSIVGIIQLDMNGLKFINDSFGHEEGDIALSTIAKIISTNIDKNMYAYRLGGDEFIVISLQGNEENISKICDNIRSGLIKTKYSCSIGWAIKKEKETGVDELIKEAEQRMYQDKELFYKNSKMERRKAR